VYPARIRVIKQIVAAGYKYGIGRVSTAGFFIACFVYDSDVCPHRRAYGSGRRIAKTAGKDAAWQSVWTTKIKMLNGLPCKHKTFAGHFNNFINKRPVMIISRHRTGFYGSAPKNITRIIYSEKTALPPCLGCGNGRNGIKRYSIGNILGYKTGNDIALLKQSVILVNRLDVHRHRVISTVGSLRKVLSTSGQGIYLEIVNLYHRYITGSIQFYQPHIVWVARAAAFCKTYNSIAILSSSCASF